MGSRGPLWPRAPARSLRKHDGRAKARPDRGCALATFFLYMDRTTPHVCMRAGGGGMSSDLGDGCVFRNIFFCTRNTCERTGTHVYMGVEPPRREGGSGHEERGHGGRVRRPASEVEGAGGTDELEAAEVGMTTPTFGPLATALTRAYSSHEQASRGTAGCASG